MAKLPITKEILIENHFKRLVRIPDTPEWREKIIRNNWKVIDKVKQNKYNKAINPEDNKVLGKYKCPYCGKVFDTIKQYKGHLLGAHLKEYKKSIRQIINEDITDENK